MPIHRSSLLAITSIALTVSSSAWAAIDLQASAVSRAVIVEDVARGAAGDKAGIQPGDVLRRWLVSSTSRETRGEITSPFALSEIELEQGPRGDVVIVGTRAGRPFEATLVGTDWKITVRPEMDDSVLAAYHEAKKLIDAQDIDRAARVFRDLAAKTSKNPRLAAWFFVRLAELLAQFGNAQDAQSAYRSAVDVAKDLQETAVSANIWDAQGRALAIQSEFEQASAAFRSALSVRSSAAPESLAAAASLNSLGNMAFNRSDLAAAENAYEESLAIREKLAPGSVPVAASLNNLGNVAQLKGDFDASAGFYARAVRIWEARVPDSQQVAWGFNNLGTLAEKRGDLAAAETFHRRSLAIAEKILPASLEVSASLNNLANVALARDDLRAAQDLYAQSLAIEEKLAPAGLGVAQTLNNLGVVTARRGDVADAEGLHHRSLAIRQKIAPDSLDVAESFTNLGVAAHDRRNLTAAEEYHRQALEILRKIAPGSLFVGDSLNNLGNVAGARGDLILARRYHSDALEIKRKLAPKSLTTARSLNNLGGLAGLSGDWAAAEDLHRAALAILSDIAPETLDVSQTYDHLARAAAASGYLALAETHGKRAVAIAEKQAPGSLVFGESLLNLSHIVFRLNDLPRAEQYQRRSLAVWEQLAPGSGLQAEAHHALSLTHREAGKPDMALQEALHAVDAFEQQRAKLGGAEEVQSSFGVQGGDYYQNAIALLIQDRRPEQAFHVQERFRARSLLMMLAERDLLFSADVPPDVARERKRLDTEYDRTQAALGHLHPTKDAAQLEQFLGRLRELRDKREAIAQQIRRTSPRLAALQYPQPLDLTSTLDNLEPGTILLSYSVGKERTLLFVVRRAQTPRRGRSALSVLTVPVGEQELRRQVAAFRASIQQPASSRPGARGLAFKSPTAGADLIAQGARLYDSLIRPAEALIGSGDRVVILPDGPLHSVPFAALVRRPPSRSNARIGYFFEWRPLHTVISATVYAELKKQRRATTASDTLIAFGDPQYSTLPPDQTETVGNLELRQLVRSGIQLAPLPATRREVEAIARLFGTRATSYLGADATEERAKTTSKTARYVHFASHGLLDERVPINSALVLSIRKNPGDAEENGLLQAWEILEHVRLDADLVVLSACETGLGSEMGGEGLVGLTRAFQYAGARSVLASLWSVADESTAELMTQFYGHLEAGKPKDEALRAAQLDLINRVRPIDATGSDVAHLAHPFYWAAFQLVGDWK